MADDNINYNDIFFEVFKKREKFTRFAFFYVNDYAVAEDLVMDVFLYCWENRNSINTDDNLAAYCLSVVKHKCIDYLKAIKLHAEIEHKMQENALWDLNTSISTLEALEPYQIMSKEYRDAVHKAIMELPSKTRKIFLMSRVHDMRYSDIANEIGISVKSVEYHISQAMKILRGKMGYCVNISLLIDLLY